jgi:hypothetical protein
VTCFATDTTVETDYEYFKQDVIKNWITYCKKLGDYSGSIKQENKWDTRFQRESQFYEYLVIGLSPNVVKEEKINGKTTVFCANSTYSFRLKSVDKSNNWTVDELVKNDNTEHYFLEDINNITTSSKRYNVNSIITRSLVAGLDLNSSFLPVIFSDPGFEITKIESLHESNENIERIFFRYNCPADNKWTFPRSGTIDLLKDHDMLILCANIISAQSNFEDQWNFVIENKYDFSQEIPLVISSQRRCLDLPPQNNFRYSMNFTYNIYKTDLVTSKRFTLSHYGLPEPDFGERRTNRIRYIIIGIGILMMAIGAYRIIQERRKRF